MMAGTRIFFAVVGANSELSSVTVDEPYEKMRAWMGTSWPEFTKNGRKLLINTALVAYVEAEPPALPVSGTRPFRVKGSGE
jgi:hypothetical protein